MMDTFSQCLLFAISNYSFLNKSKVNIKIPSISLSSIVLRLQTTEGELKIFKCLAAIFLMRYESKQQKKNKSKIIVYWWYLCGQKVCIDIEYPINYDKALTLSLSTAGQQQKKSPMGMGKQNNNNKWNWDINLKSKRNVTKLKNQ